MINVKRLKSCRGETNLLLIIVLMGFSAMFLFLFAVAVFMSHVNSILYTVKVDMFLINRSAILALNRDIEKREISSISRDDYYNYFKKVLEYNYNLDDNLKSGNRLIEQIDILQYEYFTTTTVDNVTGKTISEPTIHAEIGVKVRPIVFKNALADIFYFRIHQDVKVDRIQK